MFKIGDVVGLALFFAKRDRINWENSVVVEISPNGRGTRYKIRNKKERYMSFYAESLIYMDNKPLNIKDYL